MLSGTEMSTLAAFEDAVHSQIFPNDPWFQQSYIIHPPGTDSDGRKTGKRRERRGGKDWSLSRLKGC